MTVSFPVIQGGNSHRSLHSFAEDLGRGAVRSLLLGTRRVITRVIGTSSAEGVEITGGHLPSPAASPPLAFHPQRQLGFLPSPRGTVPFPSPRQHGGEGAQPRKSPAKLPGSFGMGGCYRRKLPPPVSRGRADRWGLSPVGAPLVLRTPSADGRSLVKRSLRQNQLLRMLWVQSLGIPWVWEMGDVKKHWPLSLSRGLPA